jgi:hypothetical protein
MTADLDLHTPWRKSSYSTSGGEECVEVAFSPEVVALRDSKHPDGGQLTLTPAAFRALLAHVTRER